MRRFTICCCAIVLVACSKSKDQPATDEMADTTTAPAAPAPIALADVAGQWAVRVMPESGGSAVLNFEMVAPGTPPLSPLGVSLTLLGRVSARRGPPDCPILVVNPAS